MRETVQSRSCDIRAARGSASRAASPAVPSGNVTRSSMARLTSRLPPVSSRTFVAGDVDEEAVRLRALTGDVVNVGARTATERSEQQL
jgi:hypothetical protein